MSAVSLSLLKNELQLQTTAEDTYLQALLDGVEDWIEQHFGILLATTAVEEDLFGGERSLWPTKVPVQSVTSVVLDGSTVASGNYTLRGNQIVHDDEWDADWYDVSYQAGYSSVPARVESLILSLCRRRYDQRGGAESEQAGDHKVAWRRLAETDEWSILADLAGGVRC